MKLPLLLLCVATLAGCVREKMADCRTTLLFSYKGDGTAEIFPAHIEDVDLYVFDEQHRLVEGFAPYKATRAELDARRVDLLLPTGRRYNIAAVGNKENLELYSLHEGTIDSTKLMHPSHAAINGTGNIDTHPHLYFGREGVAIPPEAGSTHTIEFGSSHVDMIVEVAGLGGPGTRQGTTNLSLEHSNLPGWTDFSHNCICPRGDLVSHVVEGEWDAERGVWVFTYQVMKDLKGGKTKKGSFISLYAGGKNLLADDPVEVERFIQEYLMNNPDIVAPRNADGTLLHEAVVPIRIAFKTVGVEVSIPEWAINDTHPEF